MKIISHFLIPKHKVVYVYDDFTVKEALEKIKPTRFSAIPTLDREGHYVGTLSEGDLLWFIQSKGFADFEDAKVSEVPRHRDNEPLDIKANNEILLSKAIDENFVPIIDDQKIFTGIVTRKELLNYFFERKFIIL